MLRGHVAGRSDDLAAQRLSRSLVQLLGQAEVGDLGLVTFVVPRLVGTAQRDGLRTVAGNQEHVGRLEIAMNDAALVSGVHGPGQRSHELGRGTRLLRCGLQDLGQAAALDELQRQVRPAFVVSDLVDLDNVRMLQAGDGLGFGAKTGPLGLPGVGPGQDHLQGDEAIEAGLPGLVNDPHAAAPQLAEDFIAGHDQAWRRAGGR